MNKHWESINHDMADMANALACAIPKIKEFMSGMQQFTDSLAPPVEAFIDGATVEARILPTEAVERSESTCSKS